MRNPFKRKVTVYAESTPPTGGANDQIAKVTEIVKNLGGEIISVRIEFQCKRCGLVLDVKEQNSDDFNFCPRCGKEDLPTGHDRVS